MKEASIEVLPGPLLEEVARMATVRSVSDPSRAATLVTAMAASFELSITNVAYATLEDMDGIAEVNVHDVA